MLIGEAKQILFHFPELTAAVINADDEFTAIITLFTDASATVDLQFTA
ncbi:MAG: hypothetical protein R3E08_09045 [Thiotrichaceae bacterium]